MLSAVFRGDDDDRAARVVADLGADRPHQQPGEPARAALDQHRDQAGHTRASRPGSATERAIARRFADASIAADINAVVALLTDQLSAFGGVSGARKRR